MVKEDDLSHRLVSQAMLLMPWMWHEVDWQESLRTSIRSGHRLWYLHPEHVCCISSVSSLPSQYDKEDTSRFNCVGCNGQLSGKWVNALGEKWHPGGQAWPFIHCLFIIFRRMSELFESRNWLSRMFPLPHLPPWGTSYSYRQRVSHTSRVALLVGKLWHTGAVNHASLLCLYLKKTQYW